MTEQQRIDLKDKFNLPEPIIVDLDKADGKPEVKRELLSKLKNINMFKPLKHINWFKPSNEPDIEKIGDDGFRVLTWDTLIYLEKISCSKEFQERKDIRDDIIDIIKDVTLYKIDHDYDFNNYRTSWFFIKILKNYPTDEISIDLINYFKYWIQTKFDVTLVTSEIIQGLIPNFLTDSRSELDIQKAGIILMSLLKIREVDNEPRTSNLNGKKSYYLSGDYHWINDLIEDDNLLEQLANAADLEFINFLIEQIKKQLIVTENKCSIELENNTVLICLVRDENEVRVQVYNLPGKPLYNYFEDSKFETQEKKPIKEFNVDFSSKENFTDTFKTEFINIDLLANEKERFSSVATEIYYAFYERETYESLYNSNERKPYSDPFDILSDLLKKLLVIKSNKEEHFSSVKEILTRLIHDSYLYFSKLALYVMGTSKSDYSEVFWENIKNAQINDVIFEGKYFGGELKPFLNRLTSLNQHHIELLDSYIHRGSTFKFFDETKEKYSLVWKQRLYQALSHIDVFKKMYEELRIITQQDSALAPAIGQIRAGFVEDYEGVPSITKEELMSMSNSSIVDLILKLNALGTKESISSMNGLHNSLRDIFKQNPEMVINDLSPFLNSPGMFVEMILSIIHKFPEEKRMYDAKKVIIFLRGYFYSVNWKDELQKEITGRYDIHLNNLRNVFWILRNILNDDNVIFTKQELEEIFKIFSDILSLQELLSSGIPEFTTENENENFHMRAINSKLGSIIEALIYYIRKETLDVDKDIEVKWSSKSKNLYEQLLKNNFYEAFNFVGARTNFFAWFDKLWLYEFIERSDKLYKGNLTLWKAYINGYFWDRRLYTGIYPRMKKNFMHLLETTINDSDHSISGLIQQAVGAYLYNFDGIEKGLISYILRDMKPEYIKTLLQTLIEFKHSLIFENYPEDSILITIKRERIKVLILWRVLYRYFNGKDDLTKEDKKIISSLSRLTEYLFEINSKNKDWLFQIAENINEDHYSASFIEDLNMLKDKGDNKLFVAEVIADLFIEMLKKNNLDYERENIFSILLYLSGFTQDIIKAKLSEILNKYRGRGNHELVDEFISRLPDLQNKGE